MTFAFTDSPFLDCDKYEDKHTFCTLRK